MSKGKIKIQGVPFVKEVEVHPKGGTVGFQGTSYPIQEMAVDAPVSGRVYGTLLNYKGALAELGEAMHQPPYHQPPIAPVLYIKPQNTLIGHGQPIPMPEDASELEVGAALGVVIGRRATRVSEEEALHFVTGYTVVNDVSIPQDSFHRPPVMQKDRDGFCPLGPWVIQRYAVANPDALEVRVFINGELRQQNSTQNLIRPVARLIADVTEFMTLDEGDVLLAGVPEGAPLAKVGDRIQIEIDHVGSLENTIVEGRRVAAGGGT